MSHLIHSDTWARVDCYHLCWGQHSLHQFLQSMKFVLEIIVIEFPPITHLMAHLHDQGILAWLDHCLNLPSSLDELSTTTRFKT